MSPTIAQLLFRTDFISGWWLVGTRRRPRRRRRNWRGRRWWRHRTRHRVRLGQRDVVTFQMLLQTGQLTKRFRAAVHWTLIRSLTYAHQYNSPVCI